MKKRTILILREHGLYKWISARTGERVRASRGEERTAMSLDGMSQVEGTPEDMPEAN